MTAEHVDPVCQLLITLINEVRETNMQLQRMNSIERTGAVSSVQIEDHPTKDRPVRITTKHYVGSPLTEETISEQLDAHGFAHRQAQDMAMNDWQLTAELARNGGLS